METTSKTFEINIVEVNGTIVQVNTKMPMGDLLKCITHLKPTNIV